MSSLVNVENECVFYIEMEKKSEWFGFGSLIAVFVAKQAVVKEHGSEEHSSSLLQREDWDCEEW